MKKVNLTLLILFVLVSGLYVTSCVQDSSIVKEETIQQEEILLFEVLPIVKNDDGLYSFAETDRDKIISQLEKIFIGKQDYISKIDDFGFDFTVGNEEEKEALFYVKEIDESGNVLATGFYVVDKNSKFHSNSGADLRDGSIPIAWCVPELCCVKTSCKFHTSYTCICTDINTGCSNGGSDAKCVLVWFNIGIE